MAGEINIRNEIKVAIKKMLRLLNPRSNIKGMAIKGRKFNFEANPNPHITANIKTKFNGGFFSKFILHKK